jgi:hypothetical protein
LYGNFYEAGVVAQTRSKIGTNNANGRQNRNFLPWQLNLNLSTRPRRMFNNGCFLDKRFSNGQSLLIVSSMRTEMNAKSAAKI